MTPLNLQNLHPRFKSGRRLQNLTDSISYAYGFSRTVLVLRLGNSWEQLALQRFNRLPMRGVDDVRAGVERRLDARVPELPLRDLHRHAEIVEQRRVNVAELTRAGGKIGAAHSDRDRGIAWLDASQYQRGANPQD